MLQGSYDSLGVGKVRRIQSRESHSLQVQKRLTQGEIAAQCFVFLLAGFDTTANSLAYVSYHLAKDERVRRKVQEEIDAVCIDEVCGKSEGVEVLVVDRRSATNNCNNCGTWTVF